MSYRRIYHPTANTFRDVPAAQADQWKEAGWRMSNPGQVTVEETLGGQQKPVSDTFPTRPGEALPATVTAPAGAAAPTLTTASDAPRSGR